ncbi:MAG: hypothetical protein N3B01_09920, partial [Verrucomicrobiae bacterium]|nr:hypothetical protein [Verrucomicrobiae bacterium]
MKRKDFLIASLFLLGSVLAFGQPTALGELLRRIATCMATPFERLADLVPVLRSNRQLSGENTR